MSYPRSRAHRVSGADRETAPPRCAFARAAGRSTFHPTTTSGSARDERVLAALRGATSAGSGGSRLLGGVAGEYAQLEADLAAWTGRERALLFSIGP